MVNGFDRAVFVYRHKDTGDIIALYREDAMAMTGRAEWVHVGSLEPRAWIESSWRPVMQAHGVLRALENLIVATHHLEVCPGTLEEAREAIKAAAEPQYWRACESAHVSRKSRSEREELINALRGLVEFERGHDYHHDRVGALYAADMALNRALGNQVWPL